MRSLLSVCAPLILATESVTLTSESIGLLQVATHAGDDRNEEELPTNVDVGGHDWTAMLKRWRMMAKRKGEPLTPKIPWSEKWKRPDDCLAKMTRLVGGEWVTGDPSLHETPEAQSFMEYAPWSVNHFFASGGLYVNPNRKFAMCTLEKVGCKAWNSVFHKLENQKPGAPAPDFWWPKMSFVSHPFWSATALFSDPAALRVLFVRDPLARFGSAFLNKCVRKCTDAACVMRAPTDAGKPISFAASIEWMLSGGWTDQDINPHFALQSTRCDLGQRLHEYNLVALMNKTTFAEDSTCVMKVAEIEQFNADGSGGPFWRHHSDEDSNSEFHQTTPDEDEVGFLKKLFTREKALELYEKVYKRDYEFFSLPIPSWVEEATGELLHWRGCDLSELTAATDESDEDMSLSRSVSLLATQKPVS